MIAIVLAAIAAFFLTSPVAPTAGDNLKEFGVLCQLLTACETGIAPAADDEQPQISDALETLVAINLSAADDAFFSRNFGDDSDHKGDANYTKYKEQWKKLKANTLKRKIGSSDELLQRLPDNSLRRHVQLEALAALEATQAAQAQLPKAQTAAQINAELKAVLYGQGNTAPQSSDGKTFGDNGQNACGHNGASTNKAGTTLANDMVCLCGGNGRTNPAEACLNTGGSLTNKFTNEASGPASFNELKGKCLHKDKPPTVTAEHLTALAASFRTLIGAHAGSTAAKNFHYGKGASDTCSAADEEGCVNYKKQLETAGTGIPWLAKLQEAIGEIKKREVRQAAIQQMKTKAKQEERKVLLAYKHAQAIATITSAPQAAQRTQGTQPTVEGQNKCGKFNSNETECTKNDCNYDKTTKECKPKPGSQTSAAGTGAAAGANSEGKKCSEKTKQEECKDGCKWDGTECKDSSFLLNKKLALSVVSAASMALLF